MSDEDLMELFRDTNDRGAYDALYKSYHPRIFAYHLALTQNVTTAEELTQETFCRVIDKKHLFNRARGTFSVWLYRLATNLKHDFGRALNERRP